ncbi:hypothetical protein CP1MG86_MNBNLCLN_01155 [Companilactobacillus paralimentarius]
MNIDNLIKDKYETLTKSEKKIAQYIMNGRLQQLIEFFGQVTKEDLEWRFPP